jgi:hypothetical protein
MATMWNIDYIQHKLRRIKYVLQQSDFIKIKTIVFNIKCEVWLSKNPISSAIGPDALKLYVSIISTY